MAWCTCTLLHIWVKWVWRNNFFEKTARPPFCALLERVLKQLEIIYPSHNLFLESPFLDEEPKTMEQPATPKVLAPSCPQWERKRRKKCDCYSRLRYKAQKTEAQKTEILQHPGSNCIAPQARKNFWIFLRRRRIFLFLHFLKEMAFSLSKCPFWGSC